MKSIPQTIVVLATGGTIAGKADSADDNIGYTSASVSVDELLAAVPVLGDTPIEAETVAQIDSKDMDFHVWQSLGLRCEHHLARPDVGGVVITHGTDTLEETAWFLQRTVASDKPIVLTAAMRPSTSVLADGPQNLVDAVRVAQHADAHGVLAVLAGEVHSAHDVRKTHTYKLSAFSSGDCGPTARVEEGRVTFLRRIGRPTTTRALLDLAPERWPRVDIVTSHAGAGGRGVDALLDAGIDGLIVAATGNGTVHHALQEALVRAIAAGVVVWRSSRCGDGRVLPRADDLFPACDHTPFKARVELMLTLAPPPIRS